MTYPADITQLAVARAAQCYMHDPVVHSGQLTLPQHAVRRRGGANACSG